MVDAKELQEKFPLKDGYNWVIFFRDPAIAFGAKHPELWMTQIKDGMYIAYDSTKRYLVAEDLSEAEAIALLHAYHWLSF